MITTELNTIERYIARNKPKQAERILQKVIKNLYDKENSLEDYIRIARLSQQISAVYALRSNISGALKMAKVSITYAEKANDSELHIEALLHQSHLYAHLCEFEKAMEDCNLSSNLAQQHTMGDALHKIYGTIAMINKIKNNEPHSVGVNVAWTDHASGKTSFLRNDDYLPLLFMQVKAIVSELSIEIIDPCTVKCNISFRVLSNRSFDNPYIGEEWKYSPDNPYTPPKPQYTTNLVVGLTEFQNIRRSSLRVMAQETSVEFSEDSRYWTIFIPDSYPRLGELPLAGMSAEGGAPPPPIPIRKKFKYFLGKSICIKWRLQNDTTYHVEFIVDDYDFSAGKKSKFIHQTLSLLFPFRYVFLENTPVINSNTLEIIDCELNRYKYFVESTIREADEVTLQNMFASMPGTNLPSRKPIRYNNLTGCKRTFSVNLNDEIVPPIEWDDFSTSQITTKCKGKEDLITSVKVLQTPLPISIYKNLSESNAMVDFAIAVYSLMNTGYSNVKLQVSTKIEGISLEQIDTITLLPGEKHQLLHNPRLDPRAFNETNETITTYITTTITEQQSGNRIYAQTHELKVLARNTIVQYLINPVDGNQQDLRDFIAAFVTPHAPGNIINQIIGGASKFLPSGVVMKGYLRKGIRREQEYYVHEQVRAIFRYLQEEVKLRYISTPYALGIESPFVFGQSISLPRETLDARGGNCIDLTVLFASILERLGIRTWIMFVPGHAFLGFEPFHNSGDICFLETTYLEGRDYNDAIKRGHAKYREHFPNGSPQIRYVGTVVTYSRGTSVTRARTEQKILPLE